MMNRLRARRRNATEGLQPREAIYQGEDLLRFRPDPDWTHHGGTSPCFGERCRCLLGTGTGSELRHPLGA